MPSTSHSDIGGELRYYTARPQAVARVVLAAVTVGLALLATILTFKMSFGAAAMCASLAVGIWAKGLRERLELWERGILVTPSWRPSRRYRYDQVVSLKEHSDSFEIIFEDARSFRMYPFHGNPWYVKDLIEGENPGLRREGAKGDRETS